MIRNTDSMIKAMNVQKAKERQQGWQDALIKAEAEGNSEMAGLFRQFIQVAAREVDEAMDMLRNPAL